MRGPTKHRRSRYFFDDALRDFHPEPGPSNTQRTLVNHSFPPVETLDPESPPRSSQTTAAHGLPRTSQQTLVGSSPRLQPSRKGKERRIHFDSDSEDDSDFDVGLFGSPVPPVREAEAATPNATPSLPKESSHDRESQPPPSEEPNHSDNESMDDLFDQTDMSHELQNPVVETQDEEQVIEDSDVESLDDLFDQTGYDMSHKSQTPVAEMQDEEPDIEDPNYGSADDQFDQTGYDMLDESQYPTVETQEDEQDIEALLLADPANSSTRSNITRSENVSAASQRESSGEHSDDEQSLDTDDRQIDAIHKVSRSLSTPSRHSSLGPNDRDSPSKANQAQTLTQMMLKPETQSRADTKILPATPGVLSHPNPGSSTRNRNGPRSMERDLGSPPSDDSDEDVVPSPGIRTRLRSAKTHPVVNPKTPKRAAALSDSSVDNTIPSPFTRAWQVKQELDRAAKQRPYEPPPGTRAARVRSERRL
ncbi:hypothetical protein IMY05_C4450000500 [Salix suchowensis]|nr:hypothetical protein IMY05_C4450000500 [Salix suchowensis]